MTQLGSHYEGVRRSLLEKLRNAEVHCNIVTMPDYFVDHALTCNFDTRTLTKRMLSIASTGGGEISDIHQSLEVGGNAAICTLALGKLGATVRSILKVDSLGLALLQQACGTTRIDLTGVKLTERSPLMTTILELQKNNGVANIMIGDLSRVPTFGFEDLDSKDLKAIDQADHVGVFNWLYNRKGTELAEKVFAYCRDNSHARTFLDTADPRPRIGDVPRFARKVLERGLVDVIGLNETETLVFAGLYDRKLKRRADAIQASKVISQNTGINVYLHTADYSASASRDEVAIAPAFDVKQLRGTGAGDTWNAGSIVAHHLGLTNEGSLLFANAVAARYISNSVRSHSTIADVRQFLLPVNSKLKKLRRTLARYIAV
jgi:sugar/nucleoside kinase (ribokinase family)